MLAHKTTDVVIIGSNISGSMLAAILAKNGIEVTIIDPSCHPKFSIGEATTPDSGCRFRIVGEKYDVPEISYLSNFHDLKNKVSENCGVKKSFSFLYHEEGNAHSPDRSHQFPGIDNRTLGPDCHFFRQDTDFFMFRTAIKYGANVENSKVLSIDFNEKVTVRCEGEVDITCSYVFDASGRNSVLANKFSLRRHDEFDTDSRSVFTHMINVNSINESGHGVKVPFSQSTLHHVFKDGWFWVIPFGKKNPICSVGLLLNRARYPHSSVPPEKEFIHFAKKFPTVWKQLESAKPIRKWISTGKLQYSSKNILGDRFCLSAHSAGFIDPLYSSGLNLSVMMVDLLAEKLLDAFKDNDFDTERFKPIEKTIKESLIHYDEMISNSYSSFCHYDLWDAWFRVWSTGNFLGSVSISNLLFGYLKNKNKKILSKSSKLPYSMPLGMQLKEHKCRFSEALSVMEQFKNNNISKNEARDSILASIKKHELIPPYFEWHSPSKRCTPKFGFIGSVRLYLWAWLSASDSTKNELFPHNPLNNFMLNYVKNKN